MKIKVLTARTGKAPAVEEVETDPDAFAEIVGGPARTEQIAPKVFLVFNGYGAHLPRNRPITIAGREPWRVVIRGDFLVCGVLRGKYVDLTDEQIAHWTADLN